MKYVVYRPACLQIYTTFFSTKTRNISMNRTETTRHQQETNQINRRVNKVALIEQFEV